MHGDSDQEPNGESDPFCLRKMSGKFRNDFHRDKEQCHDCSDCRDESRAGACLDKKKRNTRSEPAGGAGHRADFGHGNQQRVAESETREGGEGYTGDGDGRSLKRWMDGSETRWNRAAPAERKQQAAGGNKISVEALK